MKRFAVQMIDGSISSDWWKTIIEHFANVGDIFEIRCWKEEVSEIVRASLYGVAIDDKNESCKQKSIDEIKKVPQILRG